MNISDIEKKVFEKAMGKSYKAEDVDSFKTEVVAFVKSLIAEKSDLFRKLEVLAHKVEEYKKDEESIREALLGAQKLGKTVLAEANEKADTSIKDAEAKSKVILDEAQSKADTIVDEAQAKAQALSDKTQTESDKLIAETRNYVENTLRSCKYQIEKEQNILARTQKESSKFKSDLLELYRYHIDVIKRIPEMGDNEIKYEKEAKELDKTLYEQKLEETKTAEAKAIEEEKTSESAVTQSEKKEEVSVAKDENNIKATDEKSSDNSTDTKAEENKNQSEGLNAIKRQETREYSAVELKPSFVPNPPKTNTVQEKNGVKISSKFGELDFGNKK